MSSIKTVFEKVNSRKMKVFLLFLLCSFLAWAVSKLSETYESRANFEIVYVNIPDSLLSKGNSESISAKLRASGFQFLSYTLSPKTLQLNVQDVLEEDGNYFLTANAIKSQMENQLPNRISLVELNEPIYWTSLYRVHSRTIPIKAMVELQLAQNHLLEGRLQLNPDSVKIKGPKKDIEKIQYAPTLPLVINDVSSDFSRKIRLKPLDSLEKIEFDVEEINISGKIVRFSERKFDVAVTTKNVPEGYRLRMFPDHIQLICKAGINRLKELKATDFEATVDYNSIVEEKYLFVELSHEPEDIFSVRLLQNRLEFVLEKI